MSPHLKNLPRNLPRKGKMGIVYDKIQKHYIEENQTHIVYDRPI